MTDTLREKVAKAICDTNKCVWDSDPTSPSRIAWQGDADAAIKAVLETMQKPTRAMLFSAVRTGWIYDELAAATVWQAMIGAMRETK